MGRLRTKKWIGLGVVAVALAATAGAFGYFTSAGSGTASSSVGDAEAVTLEAGAPIGHLYPGHSANVEVTITNPNAFSIRVPSLVLDVSQGDDGFEVDSGHAGCDVSALAWAVQNNSGDGWTVPGTDAPSNELELELVDALSLDPSAANECQGAAFTVYLGVGS